MRDKGYYEVVYLCCDSEHTRKSMASKTVRFREVKNETVILYRLQSSAWESGIETLLAAEFIL